MVPTVHNPLCAIGNAHDKSRPDRRLSLPHGISRIDHEGRVKPLLKASESATGSKDVAADTGSSSSGYESNSGAGPILGNVVAQHRLNDVSSQSRSHSLPSPSRPESFSECPRHSSGFGDQLSTVWVKNPDSSKNASKNRKKYGLNNKYINDDDNGGIEGWSVEEIPGSLSDFGDDDDDDDDDFVPAIYPRSDQRFMVFTLPEKDTLPAGRTPMQSLRAYLRCRDAEVSKTNPKSAQTPMSHFRKWFEANHETAAKIASAAAVEAAAEAIMSRVFVRHNFDEDADRDEDFGVEQPEEVKGQLQANGKFIWLRKLDRPYDRK